MLGPGATDVETSALAGEVDGVVAPTTPSLWPPQPTSRMPPTTAAAAAAIATLRFILELVDLDIIGYPSLNPISDLLARERNASVIAVTVNVAAGSDREMPNAKFVPIGTSMD